MGFGKGRIGDKEFQVLEFGHGDMHHRVATDGHGDVYNSLVIQQGRKMRIGAMSEDEVALSNFVDLPKALDAGNVAVLKFTKSASVDSIIKQLQIIKQNLIENGK